MIRWRPSQELVVVVTYTVGLYMTVVDNTIIYTALPSVARDFHVSLDSAQWVTLSYLLTLAVIIPSSGWIGDRFGTRRTFIIALLYLTEHREPAAGRLDIGGFVLAGGGLALVLYALSQAPERGWASPVIIGAGLGGLVALAGLVVIELRIKTPMLNLRLLRNRIFRTTSIVGLCQAGSGIVGDVNNICTSGPPAPELATSGIDSMITTPGGVQTETSFTSGIAR